MTYVTKRIDLYCKMTGKNRSDICRALDIKRSLFRAYEIHRVRVPLIVAYAVEEHTLGFITMRDWLIAGGE